MTKVTMPRISEKQVQRDVVQLLRSIGAAVYELGTHRSKGRNCPHCKQFVPNHDFSTRQTPGLPDVFAFVPRRLRADTAQPWTEWRALWVECKAEGGRLSSDQLDFQEYCCVHAGMWYVVGGLDDVIAFLVEKGVISEKNVAAVRAQKVASGT